MSISTPSPNDVASTSRRWREGRDSAVAETRRDAFDAIDAIEHNDAQATRASSSASRRKGARTSTSSCAERRLSSLHRVVVDAVNANKHTPKKTQAPRPHAADAEPRLARRGGGDVAAAQGGLDAKKTTKILRPTPRRRLAVGQPDQTAARGFARRVSSRSRTFYLDRASSRARATPGSGSRTGVRTHQRCYDSGRGELCSQ